MGFRIVVLANLISLLFFHSTIRASESYAEWQKSQKDNFNQFEASAKSEFDKYQKALNEDWKKFSLLEPLKLYSEPKIKTPPTIDPSERNKTPEHLNKPLVDIPKPKIEPVTKAPKSNSVPPSRPTTNTVSIEYLGNTFQFPKVQSQLLPKNANKQDIADAWNRISPSLKKDFIFLKNDTQYKNLSDWALISLLHKYALNISHNKTNESQFLVWALLLNLGYDVRLSYDDSTIYVLFPSNQKIYNRSSLKYKDRSYYILIGSKPKNALYSYVADQNQLKRFNFAFSDLQPVTGIKPVKRTLTDKVSGLSVDYDTYPQLQEYYRNHPPLDFEWYFNVTPKDEQYLYLVKSLRSKLSSNSDTEKVQALLHLVQRGFNYELDSDQWGEEYYSVPMHTLMLNAVDCEDRSFLFAYLVEQVVGVSTVGLKYPSHLAVAVAVNPKDLRKNTRYFTVKGKKFFVADPTYIGANIGDVMPKYKGVTPTIIAKNTFK